MTSSSTAIRIVSLNTYLISKPFNRNRETFPAQRATRIRESVIEGKDLCFLQEVWGAGLPELTVLDKTKKKRRQELSIPPQRSPWTIFGYHGNGVLTEALNTLYLHVRRTGGLYDFANPNLKCKHRTKHTFTKSRSRSHKGVEATMWSIPQWEGGNRALLVFNTHLDPWNVPNRRHQMDELRQFFHQTLTAIDRDSDQDGQHDWSQTGVLVLGDFNIKAGSQEYDEVLMNNEGWIDFFKGESHQTYALENSLVSCPADCGRIDYVFGIDSFGSSHKFMKLTATSRSIQKEPVGMESSDHYALIVDLLPA
jgi:endonuclease/exonuclease/phosphatase family metal-dependent hydrolase